MKVYQPVSFVSNPRNDEQGEGSHFIVGFNVELDLLAGECADSVEQSFVSRVLSRCSCLLIDDAIGDGCKGGACTHLINILAAPWLSLDLQSDLRREGARSQGTVEMRELEVIEWLFGERKREPRWRGFGGACGLIA